jgi:hypothetical protein
MIVTHDIDFIKSFENPYIYHITDSRIDYLDSIDQYIEKIC